MLSFLCSILNLFVSVLQKTVKWMKVDLSRGLSLVPSACPVLGSFSIQSDRVLGPRMHEVLGHLQFLSERIAGSFCKTASGLSLESLTVRTCCSKTKLHGERNGIECCQANKHSLRIVERAPKSERRPSFTY